VNKPIINIIILNWNGTNDTVSCLRSILKSDYKNYNIILIDNGSSYENVKKLKLWCEKTFDFIV
jgi:GT2 family glycosyltransferase